MVAIIITLNPKSHFHLQLNVIENINSIIVILPPTLLFLGTHGVGALGYDSEGVGALSLS